MQDAEDVYLVTHDLVEDDMRMGDHGPYPGDEF